MRRFILSLAICSLLASAEPAWAGKIFESATLDSTGLTSGATADANNFVGVKFELLSEMTARSIGGHFLQHGLGTIGIFGALVELDSLADFPDSDDLSTSDVLATALIELDGPNSKEYAANFSGNAEVTLAPGFYGLVFGGGLFGADNFGGSAPRNVEGGGTDIGTPTYFKFKSGESYSAAPDLTGARMFVNDNFVTPVPEPSGVVLAAMALLSLAWLGRSARGK